MNSPTNIRPAGWYRGLLDEHPAVCYWDGKTWTLPWGEKDPDDARFKVVSDAPVMFYDLKNKYNRIRAEYKQKHPYE